MIGGGWAIITAKKGRKEAGSEGPERVTGECIHQTILTRGGGEGGASMFSLFLGR